MVLSTLSTLLSTESLPLLLDDIIALVDHTSGSVRKKAIVVLKKVCEIDAGYINDIIPILIDVMKDPDPSVIISSINTLLYIVEKKGKKELIPDDLVHILINLQRLVY
jgi:vesicle coat complex subunit